MTYRVLWTKSSLAKRDELVAGNAELLAYFASTVSALANGEIGVPRETDGYEVIVEFTRYKLIVDTDSDMTMKIKFIAIVDIENRGSN